MLKLYIMLILGEYNYINTHWSTALLGKDRHVTLSFVTNIRIYR